MWLRRDIIPTSFLWHNLPTEYFTKHKRVTQRVSSFLKRDTTSHQHKESSKCDPPQMLSVDVPSKIHFLPRHILPRFCPSPPGKHRTQTYRSSKRSYTLTVWWMFLFAFSCVGKSRKWRLKKVCLATLLPAKSLRSQLRTETVIAWWNSVTTIV